MAPESKSQRVPNPREGDERRHHPRVTVDWPLSIALDDGVHEARLRDVSRSGVSFYIDRRINEMTLLRLELELPGAKSGAGSKAGARVSGTGVVVRCRPLSPALEHFEVAVFLNEMAERDRVALAKLVTQTLA
jgi:hypothetical protein